MDKPRRPARRIRRTPGDAVDSLSALLQAPITANLSGRTCELAVLPVRNTVLLPNMVVPLFIDREPALRAVDDAMAHDRTILIVAQRSETVTDPTPQDVYTVGTECTVTRVLRMPDGMTSVLVQGNRRFRIDAWLQTAPFGRVRGLPCDESDVTGEQAEALVRAALSTFESCVRLSPRMTEDAYIQALNIDQVGALADYIVTQLEPPLPVRQEMLEAIEPLSRLKYVCRLLRQEMEVLELEQHIHSEVQRELDRGQREYYLREQLKTIQRELGEHDPALRESGELRERIEASSMPAPVRARALKELQRMEAMPSMAPEYSVLAGYIDWLLSVPWTERSNETIDLARVAATLDANHFGLEKVKERILEYIAVRKLAPEGRAPILCLAGPPGVGKTTLGRSIAEALGRSFARISLGGVRDEAEIRGHRRTYVGALPGRILQTMKSVGTVNPVIVLDEIDKLASDYRGDPAAALLEVLDPEQNAAFSDHYLEVPYDLSHVFFVLTANVLHTIPGPLRDRMEIIEIAGYTEEEKAQIARQFLIPRQMADTGLSSARIEIDDAAVRRIIREYTFEAGVRGLDRELGAVMRRVARRVAEGRRHKAHVTSQRVPAYLGPQKHFQTEIEERDEVGVAVGLAWTAAGGDLTTVEVMAVPGRGSVVLTGQLGDVMKESAQAALTYIRARSEQLCLPDSFYERKDIHVHLPAASVPKDGPSAGITMAAAMISALTERPLRRDVAMTGEITLRGRVLPVGGIKEKVLAAHRAGMRAIVLPSRNVKDLDDVPADVREQLTFVHVDSMDDVLDVVFARPAEENAPGHGPLGTASAPGRDPHAPVPLPETLPPSGRVARSRARRPVVVAGS